MTWRHLFSPLLNTVLLHKRTAVYRPSSAQGHCQHRRGCDSPFRARLRLSFLTPFPVAPSPVICDPLPACLAGSLSLHTLFLSGSPSGLPARLTTQTPLSPSVFPSQGPLAPTRSHPLSTPLLGPQAPNLALPHGSLSMATSSGPLHISRRSYLCAFTFRVNSHPLLWRDSPPSTSHNSISEGPAQAALLGVVFSPQHPFRNRSRRARPHGACGLAGAGAPSPPGARLSVPLQLGMGAALESRKVWVRSGCPPPEGHCPTIRWAPPASASRAPLLPHSDGDRPYCVSVLRLHSGFSQIWELFLDCTSVPVHFELRVYFSMFSSSS